jgi:ubiquinone/menaquinone biosynthesis C-methylase UbiE
MSKKGSTPVTDKDFDKAYSAPLTFWGDVRIPKELVELVKTNNPKNSLELGCGLGRFSAYIAEQGIKTTGVDFSKVAIEKAKKRVAKSEHKPTFITADVTKLEMLTEQFDVSFDIGCFHCLNVEGEQKYVSEIYRLLKPDATHLIWAMDDSPSGIKLFPEYISKVFGHKFKLVRSITSRRRIIASHWYWLVSVK